MALEKNLHAINQWQITGRVAVFNDEDAWHANLYWQQNKQSFHIRLVAPVGQKSLDIKGDKTYAVIRDSGGQMVEGNDIESLVEKQLGWRLPLYSLLYWIKALPDNKFPVEFHRFSADGYLEKLEQAGWVAEFLRYRDYQGVQLPVKIFMENKTFNVRLIIRKWEFNGPT